MYEYKAHVERVVDADTLDLMVDLGFSTYLVVRVRLARVDAWEVRGKERPEGLKAKRFVEDLVSAVDGVVVVRTSKDKGKYGRYIAEVMVGDTNLSDALLAAGHGELFR